MDNIRIRKLTPKECARLMGWNDECYERMAKVNSNSQIYKECGNAIVIQCLEAIFGQMFEGKEDFYKTSYEQLQKNNFKWETNGSPCDRCKRKECPSKCYPRLDWERNNEKNKDNYQHRR